jgi:hypothetical protein
MCKCASLCKCVYVCLTGFDVSRCLTPASFGCFTPYCCYVFLLLLLLLSVDSQNLERLQMVQKRVKRYDAALAGTYNPSGPREEIHEQLTKSITKVEKFKAVFAKLRDENPKYEHFFDHLLAFCNE